MVSAGQPSVANGQSHDENQVSSTSSSCLSSTPPQCWQAAGVVRATVIPWHLPQYQTGMRCPHQSWREMHQSRMLRIQWKKVFDQVSGTNLVLPCSTASMAGFASGSIFTNHCVDSIGSTTVSQRWQWPTACTCGLLPRSSPSSFRRALTALRALKRSRPANGPPAAVTTPLSSKIEIIGRSWRWPHSKSLGSWAGVTFTAPVPNFGSTRTRIGDDLEFSPGDRVLDRLPIFDLWRGSSGCTATAVSPSMVSGRVVATTTSPLPSASG